MRSRGKTKSYGQGVRGARTLFQNELGWTLGCAEGNLRDKLHLTAVTPVLLISPGVEAWFSAFSVAFAMTTGSKVLYEFGPFRVDPDKQVLLRENQPVSITPKAFETLLILVRHSRDVVSKDDLMKAVWPDAFVEEANLSQNIFMLRKALGDTHDDRRYIVTLPGRGYRFAEQVRTVTEDGDGLVIETHSRSQLVIEQPQSSQQHMTKTLPASARTPRWKYVLAIAAAFVLLILGLFFSLRKRPPITLEEADSVLVSDFVNATGEPIFDGTLKQAVTVKLAESPYFNIALDATTRQTLKLMSKQSDERVMPPIAREVCQREGAKVVVGGSIIAVGNKYVIVLDATNCLSGNLLARLQTEAENKDQVLGKLGQLIPPIRRKLGESVSLVEKFDTPIEQATTSSLAALKAYTSGDEKRAQGEETESIPFYKMAVDLDPQFAIAYARLGAIYADIGEFALSRHYMQEAFDLHQRVSDKEKFYIASHYYADFTKETDKAIESYGLWEKTYPHDWIPFNNISTEYQRVGNIAHEVASAREALRLNPNHGLPYAALVMAYRIAGRYAEAGTVAQQAAAVKLDGYIVHFNLYEIAFAENDHSGMQREIDWFKGKPLESWNLNHQAWAAMSMGQVHRATELFQRARSSAMEHGMKEYAAATAIDEAQLQAELDRPEVARERVKVALQILPDSLDVQAGAALALARVGDLAHAELLEKRAIRNSPANLLLVTIMLPAARAAADLRRKQPAAAAEELRRALPYDLGSTGAVPEFITPYYRGLAYLQLGSGEEATQQFQKILSNRGVNPLSLYCSLSHLGLARAYALQGDITKSRTAYREFFLLWRDADANISVLKRAKAEYSKLQETN